MSLWTIFYEFNIDKQNIEFIVNDLRITQKNAPAVKDVAKNLIEIINFEGIYAKVEIDDRPGLMLKFSKKIIAERLPHPIEGMHAFIHPSSEGYLALEDFKATFEGCLLQHRIQYQKYE
jgi:hypothetical protein